MSVFILCRQAQLCCCSSRAQRDPAGARQNHALPSVQPRISQASRNVAARGILDKWRQDNGIAVSDTNGRSTGTLLQSKPQRQLDKPVVSIDMDEDTPCPVECVTEVFTSDELQQALDDAGDTTLVVVDFFKNACGACKFIYPGFVKLCKASSAGQRSSPPVMFLKHNVYDDEEETVTQLCKQHNVRSVPKFIFFKGGQQVDSFSTRDRGRVAAAILKHAEPGSVEFGDWQPAVN